MKLYHLAYISRSQVDGTDQVIEWELESILEAAKKHNPAMGITGALLYSGGYFCQILEGPEAAVRALFDRIALDGRHDQVNTLIFEAVEERAFESWSMAFAGMEPQPRFQVEGMADSEQAIVAREVGLEMVAALARMVADRQNMGVGSGPVGVRNPAAVSGRSSP